MASASAAANPDCDLPKTSQPAAVFVHPLPSLGVEALLMAAMASNGDWMQSVLLLFGHLPRF